MSKCGPVALQYARSFYDCNQSGGLVQTAEAKSHQWRPRNSSARCSHASLRVSLYWHSTILMARASNCTPYVRLLYVAETSPACSSPFCCVITTLLLGLS